MIRWNVRKDVFGNFWLCAETGIGFNTMRTCELISRKTWSSAGDNRGQALLLADFAAKAERTIDRYRQLAKAC